MERRGLSETAILATANQYESALRHIIAGRRLAYIHGRILKGMSDWCTAEPQEFVRYLTQKIDPDPKGRYTKWLLRCLVEGDPALADFWLFDGNSGTIIQNRLSRFDDVKPFIGAAFRDIQYFKSFGMLDDFLKSLDAMEVRSIRKRDQDYENDLLHRGDATVVKDEPDYKLVMIKSHEAARHFGRMTKWCFTTQSSSHFDSYILGSQIFYVICRKSPRRFAIAASMMTNSVIEIRSETNTEFGFSQLNRMFPGLLSFVHEYILAPTVEHVGLDYLDPHIVPAFVNSIRFSLNIMGLDHTEVVECRTIERGSYETSS